MSTLKISLRQLLAQMKSDLTGKDSVKGYQPTYTWMANQLGHYGLGLSTFLILYFGLSFFGCISTLTIYIVSTLTWCIFETFNTLFSINSGKTNKTFKIDYGYIFTDLSIDLSFFTFGTTFGYCTTLNASTALICFGVAILIILIPSLKWISRIMYFQQGKYPCVYMRLSEISCKITDSERDAIELFSQNMGEKKIILIFGDRNTGKSILANAIASEYALSRGITRSLTLTKWFQELTSTNDYDATKPNQTWPWREAEIMVIDDVNPNIPELETIYPSTIKTALTVAPYSKENIEALQKNKSIWVIGSKDDCLDWVNLFIDSQIVTYENEILVITLST